CLKYNTQWIFEHGLKRIEKLSSHGSIYNTVIAGKRNLHPLTRYYFTIFNHRYFLNSSYSQDTSIRRIDYSGKLFDAKHPQVAYRKGTSLHLVEIEIAVTGFLSQIAGFIANLL